MPRRNGRLGATSSVAVSATIIGVILLTTSVYHSAFLFSSALSILPTTLKTSRISLSATARRMTALDDSSTAPSLSSSSKATTYPLPSPSNLQAVIFDIDGTLADSWKLGFDATQVVLEQNNIPTITEEEYHDGTKYSTPHRLARHAGLEPDNNSDTYDEVGARLAQEFDDLYVGLVTTETAGFFSGIPQVLERILEQQQPQRIQLGALTNACVSYAHAVLKLNSDASGVSDDNTLYSKFRSIHGADTVPSPKPDPDGLLLVCQELGVDPKNAIYVGDSPSDAGAAHNAGMASIGVTWGSHSTESLQKAPFTVLCSTVEELKAVFKL